MKIALAQIKPQKGAVSKNMERHLEFIISAADEKVDLIVFPELSLTGYEPELAEKLSFEIGEKSLDIFQKTATEKNISIAVGLPIRHFSEIYIGLCIFSPGTRRRLYTKQYLHTDELPYFKAGKHTSSLSMKNNKIEFAICYEISVDEHAKRAHEKNADLYIASVAKSSEGIKKSSERLSTVAKKYGMTTMMANNIGFCDNFEGGGRSSVWNKKGILIGQLDEHQEGMIILNTDTNKIIKTHEIKG